MLRGLRLLAAVSPHIAAATAMSAGDAHGVDNLLAAAGLRERMRQPGVQPIRIEADFVTCTQ
eukprot:COSAG03_NODE_36_length_17658_cov_56.766900_6_plen_62_part_00